ncbi:O-antigen polymerase [Terribacillus saccharophilus]|uniref:O-antigen polymerase n=1 Tax=Terribacillus saccharophilus TaxID=361277 RepID=UPI003982693D
MISIANEANSSNLSILKYMLLNSCIIVFSVFVFYFDSITLILIMNVLLILASLWVVKFDITHPYTWFTPFYVLYTISFSLLFITNNLLVYMDISSLIQSLRLSWVGLITFLFVVSPKRYISRIKKSNITYSISVANTLLIVSLIGIMLMSLYVLQSGAGSKKEIALSTSPILTLGYYSIQIYTLSYSMILISNLKRKEKLNRWFVGITILIALLVIFVVGERDFLLRITVVTLLIVNVFVRKLPVFKLVSYGVIGLFLIGILQNLKNLFVSSDRAGSDQSNLMLTIFGGEFTSSGRNFYTLVNNNLDSFFSSNTTLISDIKYALLNLPFLQGETFTPTAWFNEVFYSEYVSSGGGKGFTLVGEGYLNYGVLGIVMWFAILAFLVRLFYLRSRTNIYWFIGYILLIPMTIYCMRADLAILLSFIIKYILLPLCLIYIISYLNKNYNNGKVTLKKDLKNER